MVSIQWNEVEECPGLGSCTGQNIRVSEESLLHSPLLMTDPSFYSEGFLVPFVT